MGQRCNIVIIEAGRTTLYYDHWCANRLDVDLFWGPEDAVAFVRQLSPVAEPDGWLDEVWCEGAAVIDLDEKILLFFGGEDILCEIPRRRLHFELMRRTWPGWSLRWAYEGILSITDYLNLPRERFLDADRSIGRFDPPDPRHLEWATILISERTAAGRLRAWPAVGDWPAIRGGPGALEEIRRQPSRLPIEWPGEVLSGGVHLDWSTKTVHCWWADDTADLVRRAQAGWPGWSVHWHHGRFEAHLDLCKGQVHVVQPAAAELRRAIVHSLEKGISYEAENPALEVAEKCGGEVGRATHITRGSVGSEPRRRRILEAIASGDADDDPDRRADDGWVH